MSRPLILLCCALLSSPAFAQSFLADFNGSQRLLLTEGTLRGSPRLMGIAGAFVGIAEGAEGMTRNPASAANPDPRFESDWSYDLGGTLHLLMPWSVRDQDWDNDGRPDQVDGGALGFLGTQVIYSTLKVQYKKVALGIGFDIQHFLYGRLDPGETVASRVFSLALYHLFASLGAALWEDQLVLGVGIESTHASLALLQDRSLADVIGYHGWGIQFGGLWRPARENYRIGFAFRPATVGRPSEDLSGGRQIGGLFPFSEVVAPARISIGGSYALGNGRAYNITSPDEWTEPTGERTRDGAEILSPAMTKWLFSAQVDIFWPVENAVYVAGFIEQGTGVSAEMAGRNPSFEPRIAIEKEVVGDRLRFRLGGYLEPPMVSWRFDDGTLGAGRTRPHVTFGGEVRIYKKLTFGLSFDFAYQYMNLSVALYTWK